MLLTRFNVYVFLSVGIPYITDCVLAELEKLGSKYRVALRFE
jgi:rRNA-processing protein FCF1